MFSPFRAYQFNSFINIAVSNISRPDLSFNFPKDSKVEIDIYNIKGQKVKRLISDDFIAGKHQILWDGKNNYDKQVSSGIYFYRLNTNQGVINKKMLLLK